MGTRPPVNPVLRTRTLINSLLDRDYARAAGPILRAILSGTSSGLVAQRLAELDAEAARLAAAGQRLTPSNAILRALLADLEAALAGHAALLDGAAGTLQASGMSAAAQAVQQLAMPGITPQMLQVASVVWNVPDPEALAALVNYTSSPAWRAMLKGFPADVLGRIQNIIIRGVVMGKGPAEIARELRAAVQGMTAHLASTIMRTLQLTSYRDASTAHSIANADIIAYKVRISALDQRACMACIALHGTVYPVEARIEDHWNGRCDSISVIKGRPNPVTLTGEAWFRRRTKEQQQAQMGQAAYNAWTSGAIQLNDLVHHTTDPVFGAMVQEASLQGTLGDAAKQYYTRR